MERSDSTFTQRMQDMRISGLFRTRSQRREVMLAARHGNLQIMSEPQNKNPRLINDLADFDQ